MENHKFDWFKFDDIDISKFDNFMFVRSNLDRAFVSFTRTILSVGQFDGFGDRADQERLNMLYEIEKEYQECLDHLVSMYERSNGND